MEVDHLRAHVDGDDVGVLCAVTDALETAAPAAAMVRTNARRVGFIRIDLQAA
jgi:hypothetical protein